MDKLSILKEIDKLIQEFNDKHNPKWNGYKFLEESSVVEEGSVSLYCNQYRELTTYFPIKRSDMPVKVLTHHFHTMVQILPDTVLRDYLTVVDRIDLLLKEYKDETN